MSPANINIKGALLTIRLQCWICHHHTRNWPISTAIRHIASFVKNSFSTPIYTCSGRFTNNRLRLSLLANFRWKTIKFHLRRTKATAAAAAVVIDNNDFILLLCLAIFDRQNPKSKWNIHESPISKPWLAHWLAGWLTDCGTTHTQIVQTKILTCKRCHKYQVYVHLG